MFRIIFFPPIDSNKGPKVTNSKDNQRFFYFFSFDVYFEKNMNIVNNYCLNVHFLNNIFNVGKP